MDMLSARIFAAARRTGAALLVAAAIAPAGVALATAPAAAQTKHQYEFDPTKLTWQEYRRDDLGFRIEMPGEPKVLDDQKPGEPKDIEAYMMFDRVTFQVNIVEIDKSETLTPD